MFLSVDICVSALNCHVPWGLALAKILGWLRLSPLSLPLVSPLSPPFLFGCAVSETLLLQVVSLHLVSSGWVAIVHAWKLNDSAPKNTKMEASGHCFSLVLERAQHYLCYIIHT